MPVDYEPYISEVAGDDVELATILRERLSKNSTAAARFANGFLGKADVTRRQQEVADEKRRLAATQTTYEQQLRAADEKINKIMKDLGNERITSARATELLRTVKEKYALDEDDIPSLAEVSHTARTGNPPQTEIDIEEKLKNFKAELMQDFTRELIPELTALTKVGPILNDIVREHEDLTGKRLTSEEQNNLLEEARQANGGRGTSVKKIWEQKFAIQDLRNEKTVEARVAQRLQQAEDERIRKNSEDAINGMRNRNEPVRQDDLSSPIFRRRFDPSPAPEPESVNTPDKGTDKGRQVIPPAHQDPFEGLKGADRAAARFMQRRAAGVPLGQPDKAA